MLAPVMADTSLDPTRTERRAYYREDVLECLGRWLEAFRRTRGLQALAVSDATGCLVAGAGVSSECEELAALAPASLVSAPLAGKSNSQSIARGVAYLSVPVGQLDQPTLTLLANGCARILSI